MKWMIWYGDGSRFTSEQGDPYDAPRTNVQIIAQEDEEMGYELVSDSDYYYWEPETWGWYMADQFTMYDVLIRQRYPLILFGRMMSKQEYNKLCQRVLTELPKPKTAWRRGLPDFLRGR